MKFFATFHFLLCYLEYNASMRMSKKTLLHFLFFSLIITVPCTASSANPGSKCFPPLASGQDSLEEGFFKVQFNLPPPPPKNPDNIIHFHGNRTYSENLPLKINHIKCVRKDENCVCLDIYFNQMINPRSAKPDSILINNKPLAPGLRFAFNKKGDTIKILIPISGNTFKVKVQKIKSFSEVVIEPVEILVEVSR